MTLESKIAWLKRDIEHFEWIVSTRKKYLEDAEARLNKLKLELIEFERQLNNKIDNKKEVE